MKKLHEMLDRPMVILDVEATGTNPQQEAIFQFGAVKLQPDGTRNRILFQIKPWKPIPKAVCELCGVANEDYDACEPFAYYAQRIHDFMKDADWAGYNLRGFDLQIIEAELAKCLLDLPLANGTRIVCAQTLFMQREKRNLEAALLKYTGKKMEGAHNALNDSEATHEVLDGQLAMYEDIPDFDALVKASQYGDMVDLAGKLIKNDEGDIVYNFGNSRGMRFVDNIGLAEWMLSKDFPESTKMVVRRLLDEHYGKTEQSGRLL